MPLNACDELNKKFSIQIFKRFAVKRDRIDQNAGAKIVKSRLRPGLTAYKLFRMESCGIKHDAAWGAPLNLRLFIPAVKSLRPIMHPWKISNFPNFIPRGSIISEFCLFTLLIDDPFVCRNRFHFSQARESFRMPRIFPIISLSNLPPFYASLIVFLIRFDRAKYKFILFLVENMWDV